MIAILDQTTETTTVATAQELDTMTTVARRRRRDCGRGRTPIGRARASIEEAAFWRQAWIDSVYRVFRDGDEWFGEFNRNDQDGLDATLDEVLAFILKYWSDDGQNGFEESDVAIWASDRLVATVTGGLNGQPIVTRFDGPAEPCATARLVLLRAIENWDSKRKVLDAMLATVTPEALANDDELDNLQVATDQAEHDLIRCILAAHGRDLAEFDPDDCKPFRPCSAEHAGRSFTVTHGRDPYSASTVALLVVTELADRLEVKAIGAATR